LKSIYFQLTSIYFQLISIDFNLLSIDINLLSIYFQFTFNWFRFTFNWFQLISIYFQLGFKWFQFTFNWFSIDFNLLSIDINLLSKGFCFFSLPKVVVHNRVPSKQLYYWWSEPFMGYHLEKLFGSCFLNKGLIRHLIIWRTLHVKALTWIWLSKVKGPALPKERCRHGFCFFSTRKVGVHNRVPSTQLYFWGLEPLMRYHLETLSGCCFLTRV